MWMKLRVADVRTIAHFVGMFVVGIGCAMLLPLATAVLWREWDPAFDYLLGIGVALPIGFGLMHADVAVKRVTYAHAFTITALGWLIASFVAAVPLAFSGNYVSYLDAVFDALSGLTTSGLTVVVDLDYMSHAHNMWRHLTHLIGGQGIVVAALSLGVGLRGGGLSLYLAEGRDEKILPNVLHTVRFIWFVTVLYVGVGTLALFAVASQLGMSPDRGILHAFWMAVAAYDTGGFGPQSMNAMYYHSPMFELVTLFIMIGGAVNFSLHAQVLRGGYEGLWKDIEMRFLAGSIVLLSLMVAVSMSAQSLFSGTLLESWRKGVYHIVSAHTGTGHQAVYVNQWLSDVGPLMLGAVLLAMAAGGAVSSTAGGIKAMRLGVIILTLLQQIKEALAPRSAVSRIRYYHLGERLLNPQIASAAGTVFVLYVATYVLGALVGVVYGYDLRSAIFESVSATANVGLSTGIVFSGMPLGLKLTYMFQMWAGRLEFLAVFVLFAHLVLALRIAPSSAKRRA